MPPHNYSHIASLKRSCNFSSLRLNHIRRCYNGSALGSEHRRSAGQRQRHHGSTRVGGTQLRRNLDRSCLHFSTSFRLVKHVGLQYCICLIFFGKHVISWSCAVLFRFILGSTVPQSEEGKNFELELKFL